MSSNFSRRNKLEIKLAILKSKNVGIWRHDINQLFTISYSIHWRPDISQPEYLIEHSSKT